MTFYQDWSGLQFEWRWKSHVHYRAGQAFLNRLVGGSVPQADDDHDPPYYVLETREQYEALKFFRQRLEEG